MPHLEEAFVHVIDVYTAGNPMQEGVLWTNLTRPEIAAGLASEGFSVSVTVVDRLLDDFGYRRRKPQKLKTMIDAPQRDAQFHKIARLKTRFRDAGQPVLSMDTKKREMLGTYVRPGRVLSTQPLEGWDHDFPTHSAGVAIPHGIYDLNLQEGYIHLGTSHDTSEFAADALVSWWQHYGCCRYPDATELLLLCDSGGSNSCRRLLFKEQLQGLAKRSGLRIRVAHYPAGCSKYNPIDHRLFPHLTRVCQGLFLHSLQYFQDLLRQARTSTGLRVFARILSRAYDTGKEAVVSSVDQLRIRFDPVLPEWNYVLLPH
jgi:hypothetical protein